MSTSPLASLTEKGRKFREVGELTTQLTSWMLFGTVVTIHSHRYVKNLSTELRSSFKFKRLDNRHVLFRHLPRIVAAFTKLTFYT